MNTSHPGVQVGVIGGQGVMGQMVHAELQRRDIASRSLSRRSGFDATDPHASMAGCTHVIDLFDHKTQRTSLAHASFTAAARGSIAAAQRADVQHYVLMSIINCSDPRLSPLGYYTAKALQEEIITESPVPSTVVRSAQWFEFATQAMQMMNVGPVVIAPRLRIQPVAGSSVARYLVETVLGAPTEDPSGRTTDLAGPEVMTLPDMMRRVRASSSRPAGPPWLLPVPVPGAQRAIDRGVLVPGHDARVDAIGLNDWLATSR